MYNTEAPIVCFATLCQWVQWIWTAKVVHKKWQNLENYCFEELDFFFGEYSEKDASSEAWK
jgi:hypothetical protein